jgi:hypothetical protein
MNMDIPIDKLDEILNQLAGLKIREAVLLRKRLNKEKQKLSLPKEIKILKATTNNNRSSKLDRYWRYVKLIRDNYPHLKTSEIRKQLKIRQQGQKTEIPDAIWQNPSA